MFQFLLPILAGLGHFASGTLAGLTGAGEGLTGAAALGANLGAPLAEAGLGALIGGPQGALQAPLMAAAARRAHGPKDPGMSIPSTSGPTDPGMSVPNMSGGGSHGLSAFTQSPVMMPILGGLAGRLFGGGPQGGLMGMGLGGLLDPKYGPLANSSHMPPGLLEMLIQQYKHKAPLGNTNPDPMLLSRPIGPYGPSPT